MDDRGRLSRRAREALYVVEIAEHCLGAGRALRGIAAQHAHGVALAQQLRDDEGSGQARATRDEDRHAAIVGAATPVRNDNRGTDRVTAITPQLSEIEARPTRIERRA